MGLKHLVYHCGKVPVCRWHFGTGVNGTGYSKHNFCKDPVFENCVIALPKSSYLSSLEMRHFSKSELASGSKKGRKRQEIWVEVKTDLALGEGIVLKRRWAE